MSDFESSDYDSDNDIIGSCGLCHLHCPCPGCGTIHSSLDPHPPSQTPILTPTPTPTIVDSLSVIWKNKENSDIHFLVGRNATKISAHQHILKLRSQYFKTMLADRWKFSTDRKDTEEGIEITLPFYDPDVFNVFLEYLYTDKLAFSGKPLNVDHVLEALKLSDMYEVPPLFSSLARYIEKNISEKNVIPLFRKLRLYPGLDATKLAFKTLIGYLTTAGKLQLKINSTEHNLLKMMDEDIWMHIFNTSRKEVYFSEVNIFKALDRWSRRVKIGRKSNLMKFVPFLKFERMTAVKFTRHVVPKEILSKKEVLQWLIYFAQRNDSNRVGPIQVPPATTVNFADKRNVVDAKALEKILNSASPGDKIYLRGKTYIGNFVLSKNDVSIIGAVAGGSKISGLVITGKNCTVQNVMMMIETDPASLI